MYKSFKKQAAVSTLSLFSLMGLFALAPFSNAAEEDTEMATESEQAELTANLETAEGMIDAFYSFDANRLESFLTEAGESRAGILGYQTSAEGLNYKVLVRPPCALEEGGTIACPVTVQDDLVQALETGFDVTDTFHLTFEDGVLVNVDTSSNDQPIYRDAGVWVRENMPEVMEGPCKRTNGVRDTPGECSRARTEAYRQYKQFLDDMKAQAALDDAFIPEAFEPSENVGGWGFKLVPLGPELVDLDYAAYMSSIDHLQKTFSRSGNWPHEGITDEDAMQDMLNEQGRFERRESFAYGVLTQDGEREMGSVYIRPSSKPGYDAQVTMWVTQADYEAGFDEILFEWTKMWVEQSWPFSNVAYPGRTIDWATWDAL